MNIEQYVYFPRIDAEADIWRYVSLRFRKAGYQAIDRICDYYSTLQERPVKSQVEPGYLRKALPGTVHCNELYPVVPSWLFDSACAPETGEDFEIVADDYQKLIVPG